MLSSACGGLLFFGWTQIGHQLLYGKWDLECCSNSSADGVSTREFYLGRAASSSVCRSISFSRSLLRICLSLSLSIPPSLHLLLVPQFDGVVLGYSLHALPDQRLQRLVAIDVLTRSPDPHS